MTVTTLVVLRFNTQADDAVRPIPDTVAEPLEGDSGPMMQAKLMASQRVLEGLLNRDFKTITKSAEVLSQLAVTAPQREEHQRDDLIYEHFRTEFVRLSEQLESMAKHQNLEGAAYVHQNMTSTCIACHEHLRDRTSE
ncbi:MAG: hypothetical protein KDA93_07220 [Planctomycetaceae bacterium]|nr:hypothetical protein [Planctomycetaceae bacterium]